MEARGPPDARRPRHRRFTAVRDHAHLGLQRHQLEPDYTISDDAVRVGVYFISTVG